MPGPTSCSHRTLPVLRSRQMARRVFLSALTELMNTASPQMTGVEPLGPAIGAIQSTFSVLLNFSGKPVSGLVPLKFGPRHCGQFAAWQNDSAAAQKARMRILFIQLISKRRASDNKPTAHGQG